MRKLCFFVLLALLSVTREDARAQTAPTPVVVENSRDQPVPVTGDVVINDLVRTCPDPDCPAVVRVLDERQPFQREVAFFFNGTNAAENSFAVPADKRLVIEFFSAGGLPTPGRWAGLATVVNGVSARYRVPLSNQGTVAVAAQELRVLADPGTLVTVRAALGVSAGQIGFASVSGYLVDP